MRSLTAFISYNKANKGHARDISLFLVAESINVWFDEWEISAGDSIVDQINTGLAGCTHFLILWSRESATSKWVGRELSSILTKAIESGEPKVVPILLDNTPLPQLLRDLRYVRYNGGIEGDRVNVVEAISGRKPSSDFIRAVVNKYHEVIHDPEAKGPFDLRACPSCGSTRLRSGSVVDHIRDDLYFFVRCQECSWGDWSQ